MITETQLDSVLTDLIDAEGGFVDNPADHGGPTKYGITLATYKKHYPFGTVEGLKNLTIPQAKAIYAKDYAADFLFLDDGDLFKFLVNAAVQHGPAQAIRQLQRALGFEDEGVDGILGPKTQAAAKAEQYSILPRLIAERARFYAHCLRDKTQWRFAAGWFNRLAKDLS